MKEYLFDKKEDSQNMSESMINIEEYKNKTLIPDKRYICPNDQG